MKLRLISDAHLEADVRRVAHLGVDECDAQFRSLARSLVPVRHDDGDCVLVCAGDMITPSLVHHTRGFWETFNRFRAVVYIPGNHEFYGADIDCAGWNHIVATIRAWIPDNLITSNGAGVVSSLVDDTTFIAGTLWTNFNKSPQCMMAAQMSMNDYRMIRAHGHPLTADMLLAMHNSQLDQIRKLVAVAPGDCVVVTHHAPSLQSIHSKYKRADLVSLNGAFVSDYDQLITDELTKVKVWCHGHTHDAFDYSVGATRVVCNPVGYPSERKSNGFKSEKAVLVE